jgi:glycosyltransferase involved in cell wall biosynthesis
MLSIVVPCFNEEQGLERLRSAVVDAVGSFTDDFEVLLVDDGSTDHTLAVMRRITEQDPRFRYLALSRNFGKESAMLAGLSHALGDVVGIMDADLQHPPELFASMVPLLEQGYDQVVARRTRDGDARVRTALSRTYYRLINKMVDVDLEDGVGDFRVLTRRAVSALLALDEHNRFSKGLFAWIGFDTAVVDYENEQRQDGESKWTLHSLLNYGIDGVVSFNSRPLRLAVALGGIVTAIAFGYGLWVLTDAIVNDNPVPGYVTLMCGVLFLGGLQLLFLGVIGEYIGRIYSEAKGRPHFLVKESSDRTEVPVTTALGAEHAEREAAGRYRARPATAITPGGSEPVTRIRGTG